MASTQGIVGYTRSALVRIRLSLTNGSNTALKSVFSNIQSWS